tara:strand:- start:1117 stop:1836 length:720 start_codon:yes stop_codon:yes gene_type:complete
MEKAKKIKIFLGLFYFISVGLFLYLIFSKFSVNEITSYSFIKDNRDYFFELRNSNLFFLGLIFILFTIIWILALGFLSPLGLFAGFIFGKIYGVIFLIFGTAIGATLLYLFANYFVKDMIRDKFLNKFQNLETKFKKSEFLYLLIFRFVGGTPFNLQNLLPCIFNVKVSNFFWSTLIGIFPQTFLIVSIGSGLEKVIEKNTEAPGITDIIFTSDVYIPILAFFGLIIITIFLRKLFYKN